VPATLYRLVVSFEKLVYGVIGSIAVGGVTGPCEEDLLACPLALATNGSAAADVVWPQAS